MASTVYFGSAKQSRLSADETLPAKLDRILERLNLRDRVKDETVAIKMHLGGHVGYTTVHPIFVRKIVQAVKDGGGRPFVTDTAWAVATAAQRGYTAETVGCPLYPTAGPDEKHYYVHTKEYKGITEWRVAGMLQEATFVVDLSHVKGHPDACFGAAFKNLALGGMTGATRGRMHDTVHYDAYWFKDRCDDEATRQALVDSCAAGALVRDKNDPEVLHRHFGNCRQCFRCLEIASEGSLTLNPANFASFHEACAIAASLVLSTFEPGKGVFLNLATDMTPWCDCFGFSGLPAIQDVGLFGSDDIVAVEQATLDMTAKHPLLVENLPESLQPLVNLEAGHPFAQIWGKMKDPYLVVQYAEGLGLGSRQYEFVDVLPLEKPDVPDSMYVAASRT